MTGPVLAGRTPGVHLDDRGRKQAAAVAERIAVLPLTAIVTSPMERCVETAEAIRDRQVAAPPWQVEDRLVECGYGDWTGRSLKELTKDPLWKVVQSQPSAGRVPNGEGLGEMATPAGAAGRSGGEAPGGGAGWGGRPHGGIHQ